MVQNHPKFSLLDSDRMAHKLQIFGQMRKAPRSRCLPVAPEVGVN